MDPVKSANALAKRDCFFIFGEVISVTTGAAVSAFFVCSPGALSAAGARVWRTDTAGDVVVVVRDGEVGVVTRG